MPSSGRSSRLADIARTLADEARLRVLAFADEELTETVAQSPGHRESGRRLNHARSDCPMAPGKTVKDYIRTIVDFPHEGIMFRDVTTLFADPRGFRMAIDQLLHPYAGVRFDKVVGLEARGFILGGAVAHQLSAGFVPIRKKGKLPGAVISEDYQL